MLIIMDLDRPEIGQDIYVPTSLYMSHGRNDFQGGLCEVIAVEETNWGSKPTIVVEVKEREGHNYNWTGCLAPNQEKYKEK